MDQNIELESLAATAELSLYHFDFARTFKQSEGNNAPCLRVGAPPRKGARAIGPY
jgi:hypothetical protein